jgi:predicted PurR-regulated permease PerM
MLVTLLVAQAQDLASGVLQPELLAKVTALKIGPFAVGPQLKELGAKSASLLGGWLLALAGSATQGLLQLTIAFFGMFYLLLDPERAWREARPFIPFTEANQDALRARFTAVTTSTLVGTLLTSMVQGTLLGVAFAIVGLPNAVLWGAVTVVFAILPVVGSGMVWVPATAYLLLQQRYGPALFVVIVSVVFVANIDNVIRPWVFARFASIHPFVTIIGAFAGIQFFGLLGLAMGPLAISYFFELIQMYRAEYGPAASYLPIEGPVDAPPVEAPVTPPIA